MRDLQSVIGHEARKQFLDVEGRLPEAVVACVGGGSNAIGIFAGFVDDADVRLIGVEAAGAASLGAGRAGVLHGARSSILADDDGQILDAHSISAGLDYPGVGPEHAFLRDSGRADYVRATDDEALAAFRDLTRTEGIIPALEPAHALARARELDETYVLVCLSGRGDKDLAEVLRGEPLRPGGRAALRRTRSPTSCGSTSCSSARRSTTTSRRSRRRSAIPAVGGEASLPPFDADDVALGAAQPASGAEGARAPLAVRASPTRTTEASSAG